MFLHKKKRLLASVSAVAFTVLIVFMELGFFNGIKDSQSYLATVFRADLIMMHHRSTHLNNYEVMEPNRLAQAGAVEHVLEVIPVYKRVAVMKHTEDETNRRVFVLAYPPDSAALDIPMTAASLQALKSRGNVLFDSKSRRIYGDVRVGEDIKLDGVLHKVVGMFSLGPNFSNDGNVLMGEASFLLGKDSARAPVTYGLIRAEPGTNLNELKQTILQKLPKDIAVMTPEEMRQREVLYTTKSVPIGMVFKIAALIGFLTGIIICYQILYNEIADHLHQFGTLKAMGFSNAFLVGIVIQQTVLVAFLGFLPGFVATIGLYAAIESMSGILMEITMSRAALVFSLTLGMSFLAGLMSISKVMKCDPVEVFR